MTIDPDNLVVMPDMNGNSASGIALSGTRANESLTRIIIKNSKTGALVGNVGF